MKLSDIVGTIEIKQFHKFEDGRKVSYFYSIKRDKDGTEISRTEPENIGSIGWDNGKPFTEDDYKRIKRG